MDETMEIKRVVVNNMPSGCWTCPLFYNSDGSDGSPVSCGCMLLDVDLDDERYESERHTKCLLVAEADYAV